jgi:hypothetical protein
MDRKELEAVCRIYGLVADKDDTDEELRAWILEAKRRRATYREERLELVAA